jgi:hypothetical protein
MVKNRGDSVAIPTQIRLWENFMELQTYLPIIKNTPTRLGQTRHSHLVLQSTLFPTGDFFCNLCRPSPSLIRVHPHPVFLALRSTSETTSRKLEHLYPFPFLLIME